MRVGGGWGRSGRWRKLGFGRFLVSFGRFLVGFEEGGRRRRFREVEEVLDRGGGSGRWRKVGFGRFLVGFGRFLVGFEEGGRRRRRFREVEEGRFW